MASFITRTNGTALAANLDWSHAKHLNETVLRKWDVKVMNGVKVGFVGFAGTDFYMHKCMGKTANVQYL